MPRIDRNLIESTFHLYENSEDARAGRNAQGTGFVVVHPGKKGGDRKPVRYHAYGVTNQHVASQYPVVRLNRDSDVQILEFGPEDWEFHPNGDDVAVVPLGLPMDDRHRFYPDSLKAISTTMFAPPPHGGRHVRDEDVGVGDDVFMIGLFVDHEGREQNNPLARFGNISMLPSEATAVLRTVYDRREIRQISYIVDMHSRTGYSGSPVFVYRTFASDLTRDVEQVEISTENFPRRDEHPHGKRNDSAAFRAEIRNKRMLLLLGIHWAQFGEEYELHEPTKSKSSKESPGLIVNGYSVSGFSGMTLVVPAWKILELLNLPALENKRAQAEAPMGSEPGSGPIEE